MAVAIRLTRVGRSKAPYYRMVVADSHFPRDGRFIEILGHYQPLQAETKLKINEERALHWLDVGAQPSDTARSLLRKLGIMKKWHDARAAQKKPFQSKKAAKPAAEAKEAAPQA
jgi:small subunit ribosomal protein S16